MADDSSSDESDDFERLDVPGTVFVDPKATMRKFDTVLDDVSTLINLSTTSKDHMNMLKRNFWFLICSRVGISITEEESVMKEDAMWLLCYERLIETKENFSIQSNVEFIFENCPEKDFPPEVLDDIEDRLLATYGSKWAGLKHEKIKNAFIDDTKNHYYVGSRIWETWRESKRYIQNCISPH
jgi:hypothetical protein